MSDSDLLTLVILAAVAGFLLFRLRSVLGERTGFEKQDDSAFGDAGARASAGDAASNNVVNLNRQPANADEDIFAFAELDTPLGQGLKRIKTEVKDFDTREFVEGSKAAYEMLLTAFEEGDRSNLRDFLSDDVFAAFDQAIASREKENLSVDMRFVGIRSAEPIEAAVHEDGGRAEVTMRFVAEVVRTVRNSAGEIVDGDPSAVTKISDVWTFAKSTASRDPNWLLVATEA